MTQFENQLIWSWGDVCQDKQQVELILYWVPLNHRRRRGRTTRWLCQEKGSSQRSNDGKPCGKHDGNQTCVLVSGIHVRKVTISSSAAMLSSPHWMFRSYAPFDLLLSINQPFHCKCWDFYAIFWDLFFNFEVFSHGKHLWWYMTHSWRLAWNSPS